MRLTLSMLDTRGLPTLMALNSRLVEKARSKLCEIRRTHVGRSQEHDQDEQEQAGSTGSNRPAPCVAASRLCREERLVSAGNCIGHGLRRADLGHPGAR